MTKANQHSLPAHGQMTMTGYAACISLIDQSKLFSPETLSMIHKRELLGVRYHTLELDPIPKMLLGIVNQCYDGRVDHEVGL
jgi:hypothetical protein